MKRLSYIKQYIAVLMCVLFMPVGCQQIPDLEDMITDDMITDDSLDSSEAISDIMAKPDDSDVVIDGTVMAVTQRGFLLSDDTDLIYVYGGPQWEVSVDIADEVEVCGLLSTYWNNREILLGSIRITGKGNVSTTVPYELTASNKLSFAQAGYKPRLVTVEGLLTYDGLTYNIIVGDDTITLTLKFPIINLSGYLNKSVKVTGYYLWTSTSDDDELYMDIILTDIEEIEQEEISVSSANCYIISSPGNYSLRTVKGNSTESVGRVSSAEVLWESFGTDVTPKVGELISSVEYSGGKIIYTVSSPFKEGNAVIAAKDASGTILWSWHIWMTDMPEEQVYTNNAGILMDRNLGATSATPGEVGTYGLYYQWGRKDPFLGATNTDQEAKSTNIWPSSVKSSSTTGTMDYAIQHPMTFISYSAVNYDWMISGSMTSDHTRWGTNKTIYDPCPSGWRVPDGGREGFWVKSGLMNSDTNDYYHSWTYQSQYDGMIFDQPYCLQSVWYPSSGQRNQEDGRLYGVSLWGEYHAISPQFWYSEGFKFSSGYYYVEEVGPSYATGAAVRCYKIE